MYFIVDLDGTVCNSIPRIQQFCRDLGVSENADLDKVWSPEQMRKFLSDENLKKDPLMPGAEKLFEWADKLNFQVVFLTGRNQYAYGGTRRWLREKFGERTGLCELLMRPKEKEGQHPADVKEEMFLKWKSPLKQGPFIFFEDQEHTAERYAKHGLVLKSPQCWDALL